MEKTKTIVGNFCFVLAARVLEMISGILVTGLLARYLGLHDFGEYALMMAVVFTVQPVISMAVPKILVVELSQDMACAPGHIGTGMTVNLIVGGALMALWWTVGLSADAIPGVYAIGISIALFISLTQTVGTIPIARERMRYETCTSLIATVLLFAMIGWVIFRDLGLVAVFWAQMLSALFGFSAAVWFGWKTAGFVSLPRLDISILRMLISKSHILTVIQVLVQLSLYCGVFFLKHDSGNVEVALFQAPMRIFTRFMIIPLSLMIAVLPLLSQMAADPEKKSAFEGSIIFLFQWLLIGGMAIAIIGVALARKMIPLIFGNEFVESIEGFQHIVLGTVFFFGNQLFLMLSILCDRMKRYACLKFVEVAGMAVFNMIAVPVWGHMGSIWSLIVFSGLSFWGGFFLFRDILQKTSLHRMLVILASGYGIIAGIKSAPSFHFAVSLPAGLIAFAAAMILFRIVGASEIRTAIFSVRSAVVSKKQALP